MNKLLLLACVLLKAGQAYATQAVLAVSLSMPSVALKQYIQQAHTYHIPIVIRGLYTTPSDTAAHKSIGSFHDTEVKIKSLIGKSKHGGIAIDPMVFRSFQVKVVPTLIVFDSSCDAEQGKPCSKDSYDMVKGNIPIQKQLTIIARKSASQARIDYSKQTLNQYPEIKHD